MIEILTALGLVFVIEGAFYALFPEFMKRMMANILTMPVNQIRIVGLVFTITGFLLVLAVKG